MRFVAVKTVDQRAVLMLHKVRDLLVRQRTMLINALRGHLAVITHHRKCVIQAPTVVRMVLKGLRPARRAVSTTVRMAASPSAAHIAR